MLALYQKHNSLLGDQGDKLTTIAMHSKVFYALKERKALDYVTNTEARLSTAATGASTINAFGGSSAGAYGDVSVPQYMGMNIVVSDDIPKAGSGASTEYAVYFFAQGSVATGEQAALETLVDRDVLAFEDVVSFKHAYIYHPIGTKWAVTTTNPTRTQLETATNWSKVYDTKNIGIVRATVTITIRLRGKLSWLVFLNYKTHHLDQLTKTKVIKTENGAMTLTTAELIEGIVDGTPTGNRTITTPTAAEILTALGVQNKVSQTFELTVVNKAASTHKYTLTAGPNVTTVGDQT